MSDQPSLVIVSGLSGAGRTTVMKALEDLGFYCVDNLPVVLLESLVALFSGSEARLAVDVGVREGEFLESFPAVSQRLRSQGILSEMLFLEASDEVLAQRFDETRRVHPAAHDGSVLASIARERRILSPLAERADLILDTSQLNVHELRRLVTRRYAGESGGGRMEIELISFGFRHGVLDVADLVIDVRFLPNPNFEAGLADRTGLDSDVAAYVLKNPRTEQFLGRFFDFLEFLLPLHEEEGKAYFTLGVGCTGGQHRSVAVAAALERHLREREFEVRVTHRDVERSRRAEN